MRMKVFIWFLPSINICCLYLFAYIIIPILDLNIDMGFSLGWFFYLMHIIFPIVIPPLLLLGVREVKTFLLSVSSIMLSNVFLLTPELIYIIQANSIYYFDEDTFYRTIVLLTTILSLISGGFTWFIGNASRKQ